MAAATPGPLVLVRLSPRRGGRQAGEAHTVAPLPRTRRLALVLLFATLMTANGMAGAKEPTPLQNGAGCLHDEPDSVQISWEAPCQDGSWLMDTELGCRMWDWHPAPEDKVTWTGACRAGIKMGRGVLQWYEHGRPIDRFEGTFVSGRRQGSGRYVWNETDWYEGILRKRSSARLRDRTYRGRDLCRSMEARLLHPRRQGLGHRCPAHLMRATPRADSRSAFFAPKLSK